MIKKPFCPLTPFPYLPTPRHSGPSGRRPPGRWRTPRRPRELVTAAGWRAASQSFRVLMGYPLHSGRFVLVTSISPRTSAPYILHLIALPCTLAQMAPVSEKWYHDLSSWKIFMRCRTKYSDLSKIFTYIIFSICISFKHSTKCNANPSKLVVVRNDYSP